MESPRKRNSAAWPPPVLLLDAVGTLIRPAEPVGTVYARAAARFGAAIDPAAAEAAFRDCMRATPPPCERPGPSPDDDRGWWRTLVAAVLDRFVATSAPGFDRDACFDFLYRTYGNGRAWRPYPEVPGFLARCRDGGHRLAVVSNFDRRLRAILDDLGLRLAFEAVVLSSEVGASKPSARIFEAALGELSAAPESALHIGDDPVADWEGARRAGIRAFPLDRSNQNLDALWRTPGAAIPPAN